MKKHIQTVVQALNEARAALDYDAMAKEAETAPRAQAMVNMTLSHVTNALPELEAAIAAAGLLVGPRGRLTTRDVQTFKDAVMKAAAHAKKL